MLSYTSSRRQPRRHSLLLCALSFQCAIAQQCYYPDGSQVVAETVYSCNSNGGACCPQNWECQSNGLCYNKAANYLGRYSCTDKSWGSSCPNFCLDNGSLGGDQAVLQCSDGRYCCDANRVSFNCCDNGAQRFDLPNTAAAGSATSVAPTSSAQPSSSSPSPSSTSTPSSAAASSTPSQQTSAAPSASSGSSPSTSESTSTPAESTTHVVTSATSASVVSAAGQPVSTVLVTRVSTSIASSAPTAGAAIKPSSTSSSSSSSNKTPLIIGLAVGIPVGIALLAIPFCIFCFRRRRRGNLMQKERRREQVTEAYAPGDKDSKFDSPLTPEFANSANTYSAKHVRQPSELDGRNLGIYHPEAAELSGDPRSPRMAEAATPSGTPGWQPPTARRYVGGLAYSHRPTGSNRDYQPYLAELPS